MTPTPCPQPFLDLGQRLCDASAQVIIPHFRANPDVERKADSSPVTVADRGAESAMRTLIIDSHPDHGIYGEEFGSHQPEAEYLWVLDPIDGTRSFVAGHPLFGTLIALLHNGQPIMGIISMPITGEKWVGAQGHPTRFTDHRGTGIAQTRRCPDLATATLATTSPALFRSDGEQAAYHGLATRTGAQLMGGDCYNYGLIANGTLDLVLESGLGVYDYMAHVPIINGAGGQITDWAGQPLHMGSTGQVLATGDGDRHRDCVALIAELSPQPS